MAANCQAKCNMLVAVCSTRSMKKATLAPSCSLALIRAVVTRFDTAGESLLYKSGRPDSNRRRPAWEAGILPTELRPRARNGDAGRPPITWPLT
jgi:hypothetical protein